LCRCSPGASYQCSNVVFDCALAISQTGPEDAGSARIDPVLSVFRMEAFPMARSLQPRKALFQDLFDARELRYGRNGSLRSE
jgi:hypothetical protein